MYRWKYLLRKHICYFYPNNLYAGFVQTYTMIFIHFIVLRKYSQDYLSWKPALLTRVSFSDNSNTISFSILFRFFFFINVFWIVNGLLFLFQCDSEGEDDKVSYPLFFFFRFSTLFVSREDQMRTFFYGRLNGNAF